MDQELGERQGLSDRRLYLRALSRSGGALSICRILSLRLLKSEIFTIKASADRVLKWFRDASYAV